jgi:hypothetical protein
VTGSKKFLSNIDFTLKTNLGFESAVNIAAIRRKEKKKEVKNLTHGHKYQTCLTHHLKMSLTSLTMGHKHKQAFVSCYIYPQQSSFLNSMREEFASSKMRK